MLILMWLLPFSRQQGGKKQGFSTLSNKSTRTAI